MHIRVSQDTAGTFHVSILGTGWWSIGITFDTHNAALAVASAIAAAKRSEGHACEIIDLALDAQTPR